MSYSVVVTYQTPSGNKTVGTNSSRINSVTSNLQNQGYKIVSIVGQGAGKNVVAPVKAAVPSAQQNKETTTIYEAGTPIGKELEAPVAPPSFSTEVTYQKPSGEISTVGTNISRLNTVTTDIQNQGSQILKIEAMGAGKNVVGSIKQMQPDAQYNKTSTVIYEAGTPIGKSLVQSEYSKPTTQNATIVKNTELTLAPEEIIKQDYSAQSDIVGTIRNSLATFFSTAQRTFVGAGTDISNWVQGKESTHEALNAYIAPGITFQQTGKLNIPSKSVAEWEYGIKQEPNIFLKWAKVQAPTYEYVIAPLVFSEVLPFLTAPKTIGTPLAQSAYKVGKNIMQFGVMPASIGITTGTTAAVKGITSPEFATFGLTTIEQFGVMGLGAKYVDPTGFDRFVTKATDTYNKSLSSLAPVKGISSEVLLQKEPFFGDYNIKQKISSGYNRFKSNVGSREFLNIEPQYKPFKPQSFTFKESLGGSIYKAQSWIPESLRIEPKIESFKYRQGSPEKSINELSYDTSSFARPEDTFTMPSKIKSETFTRLNPKDSSEAMFISRATDLSSYSIGTIKQNMVGNKFSDSISMKKGNLKYYEPSNEMGSFISGKTKYKYYEFPNDLIPSTGEKVFYGIAKSGEVKLPKIPSDYTIMKSTGSFKVTDVPTTKELTIYNPNRIWKFNNRLLDETYATRDISISREMGGTTSKPGKYGLITEEKPSFTYTRSKGITEGNILAYTEGESLSYLPKIKGVTEPYGGGSGGFDYRVLTPSPKNEIVMPGGIGGQTNKFISDIESIGIKSMYPRTKTSFIEDYQPVVSTYWQGTKPSTNTIQDITRITLTGTKQEKATGNININNLKFGTMNINDLELGSINLNELINGSIQSNTTKQSNKTLNETISMQERLTLQEISQQQIQQQIQEQELIQEQMQIQTPVQITIPTHITIPRIIIPRITPTETIYKPPSPILFGLPSSGESQREKSMEFLLYGGQYRERKKKTKGFIQSLGFDVMKQQRDLFKRFGM